jgi:hypothetical protein
MLFFSRDHLSSSIVRLTAAGMLAVTLSQCTSVKKADVVVSVKDQKLGLYSQGELKKTYKISTSKFGVGDKPGSNRTPLGQHEVVAKIGQGLPAGAVLKSRRWNGEVLKPDAPGRDPIVSRILWLKGTERSNRNAYGRFIYIHGTPEERNLGRPASYGCVRMGLKDVVNVFNSVNVGAKVYITTGSLPKAEAGTVENIAAAEAAKTNKDADAESPALDAPVDSAIPIEIAKMEVDPREKAHAESKAKVGPSKPATKSKSSGTPKKRSTTVTKKSGSSKKKAAA